MNTSYVKTKPTKLFNVSGIYSVHYFRYGRNFAYEGESHDFWELVYIDGGTAQVTAEDKTKEIKRGSVIFHKPQEYHNIKPKYDYANSIIVSFECKSEKMKTFENKVLTLSAEEQLLLSTIIAEGAEAFEGKMDDMYMGKLVLRNDAPSGSMQIITNSLETLLVYLYRKLNTSTTVAKKSKEGELVQNIKKLLASKIYDNVSLSYVASSLFFSKTHVKETFRKETGKTVMAYYNELKIEEAKKLIGTNLYSLTQIALKLGFRSVQYFSQKFKAISGQTPSEYAKRVKITNLL